MKYYRTHTKIVATLGPATSDKAVMIRMIKEGVNVFRLNFSHSKREEHLKSIQRIREINNELGSHVSILADLQGPKLRVGEIENNRIDLIDGETITFVTEKCMGTKEHIYMSYPEFPRDVQVGEAVLIDDGKIKLEVVSTNHTDKVVARVVNGGPLSSKKGVNLPNTEISLPCLTDEDITNANFALEQQVDWIALSFVRNADDINALKRIIQKQSSDTRIIAKIEKPEALEDIDEIINRTDAIMVARGDLGVEVPFNKVPLIQKHLVQKCIEKAKPVIIATQMMESMITNFRPTRAEATDVANAVLDGADALMLSGETSVGKFPAETIANMRLIIENAEQYARGFKMPVAPTERTATFLSDSICYNAVILSHQVKAKAIVVLTNSGYSAYQIASHRPDAIIIAFTDNPQTVNKLSLVWGIVANYMKTYESLTEALIHTTQVLKDKNLVKEGDILVNVASIPLKFHGKTNTVKVSKVE
ncbi:MAG: pyruvate kinase [Fibrobacteraceae bacterium]|nr:pyruvate kinase [Fibrobacteraceae bacterium]